MTRAWVLLAALGATTGSGCRGTITGGPVDEADFAAAYAHAYCGQLAPCCQAGGLVPGPSCEATIAAQQEGYMKAASAGGARYDAAAGGRCVAGLATWAAQCPTPKSPPSFPDGCWDVYTNKPTPSGAPCESPYQCADQPPQIATCVTSISGSGTSMTCELWIVLGPGESCAHQGASPTSIGGCASGTLCDPSSETCQPFAKLGEPCVTGQAWGDTCGPGAVCDRLGSKRCVAAVPWGQACSSVEQCEFLGCTNGTCEAQWPGAPVCVPP